MIDLTLQGLSQPLDMTLAIDLQEKLEQAGQTQLVQFWDELNESQQKKLADQIAQIDFDEIATEFAASQSSTSQTKPDWNKLAEQAVPPSAIRVDSQDNPFTDQQAKGAGESALRAGHVGFVLVAGGQGTRLGFPHPKGMFPIGPVSERTLFEVLIDLLRARSQSCGKSIPLYLMTSPATHDETVEFLEKSKRFGLAPDELTIFCQGTMPAVDAASGKILLSEKDQLALSPDGHGGMLAALENSGCFDDMRQRGIKHLFYGQIDNPLIQVCDPVLIGHHILAKSELTTQVVEKSYPLERVGNVVSIDQRVQIIEYSDLPDEVAEKRNSDGSIFLWAGNIAVHVFETSFLQRAVDSPGMMPFHLARKKVPFVNTDGALIEPDEPNAIKFERFIFDLLPLAQNAIAIEGRKSEVFAPVKNGPGEANDTAAQAQQAIIDLHSNWLKSAGAIVDENVAVEISPFFAINADEVKQKIEPGKKIDVPTYLQP